MISRQVVADGGWMAPGRRAVLAGCALLALALAGVTSCGSPAAPGPANVTLRILYTQPSPETLPPPGPDAGMCAHHYAPVNLQLETSWGESRRLAQVSGLEYGLTSSGVSTAQDHWLTFVDIALCSTDTVRVTRGVTVNGVVLTRIIDRSGIPTLAFRADASGRVVP